MGIMSFGLVGPASEGFLGPGNSKIVGQGPARSVCRAEKRPAWLKRGEGRVGGGERFARVWEAARRVWTRSQGGGDQEGLEQQVHGVIGLCVKNIP